MPFCSPLSSRASAVGETCGQLRSPVLLYHQRGNCIHLPLQSGCPAILSHQHRHPETRQAALDNPLTSAWQGRPGWDSMKMTLEYEGRQRTGYCMWFTDAVSGQYRGNSISLRLDRAIMWLACKTGLCWHGSCGVLNCVKTPPSLTNA